MQSQTESGALQARPDVTERTTPLYFLVVLTQELCVNKHAMPEIYIKFNALSFDKADN